MITSTAYTDLNMHIDIESLYHPIFLSFFPNSSGESIDVIVEFVPTSVRTYNYALSVDILGTLRVLIYSFKNYHSVSGSF